MKKFFLLIFVLVSVVASALIAIPVFYDVNTKIKPLVIQAIEKNGRAMAEVGPMSLSLWGKVRVAIEGLRISEKKSGETVFFVKDAELVIPFMSLISGTLDVRFQAEKSEIFLVKKEKTLNIFELFSADSTGEAAPPAVSEPTTKESAAGFGLSRLQLSILISDALVSYVDPVKKSKTQLDQINFELKNFKIGAPFEATLSTNANYHGPGVDLEGPISLKGQIMLANEDFDEAQVQLTLDMSETKARYTNLLKKDAGVPSKIDSKLSYKKPRLTIEEVNFLADDLNVLVEGYVDQEPELSVQISARTENLNLAKLHNVISSFKEYNVSGLTSFLFKAEGPLGSLKYSGYAKLKSVSGKKGKSDFQISGEAPDLSRVAFRGQMSARQLEAQDFSEYKGITLKNFSSPILYQNEQLEMKGARFEVFGGRVDMDVAANTKLAPMSYNVKTKVSDMDVNAAIQSQMPEYKDTLKGQLDLQLSFSGRTGAAAQIQESLSGSGQFNLKDGSWSGLAGVKMLAEKLKSIPHVQEKAKDVKVGDRFQTFKSQIKIADKKIYLQQIQMDLKDSRTSLKGDADVGFDKNFYFKGFVYAPLQNPPMDIRGEDGRAKLPVEMTGKVNDPAMKWEATTSVVAQAYLKEEGSKVINKELKKLKENVKDEEVKKLLDKVPDDVGDLLKNIKF
ncbi:MAG: AsmA family protein [Bdellovibrionales bacterium]